MNHTRPLVDFLNQSTLLSDDEVRAILEACHRQVVEDFGPIWHTSMRIPAVSGQPEEPGGWTVVFKDDSDIQGALGYHDVNGGIPVAYVFAKTATEAGVAPSSVASHELLEMLVDPLIDTGVQDQNHQDHWYAQEVCDQVEQSSYEAPDGSGILVSDFVTPQWFIGGSRAPYDLMNVLQRPLQLEPGGSYIGVWSPQTGWTSIDAEGKTATEPDPDDARRCLRPFQRAGRYPTVALSPPEDQA